MDWIHCNTCNKRLERGITLYLTSCGHLFCPDCLAKGEKENICLLCRAQCTKVKISSDMNQDIKDYFMEPEELIKKCGEVLQFQRRHRLRLISYLSDATSKFYKIRAELVRMMEMCQKQQKQLKEYRKTIKVLELKLSSLNNQGSPFVVPISPTNKSPLANLMQKAAKSTPYSQPYQSNLVTPTRISKSLSGNCSGQSQMPGLNTPKRMSSSVLTPSTPHTNGSAPFDRSYESGYMSSSPWSRIPYQKK